MAIIGTQMPKDDTIGAHLPTIGAYLPKDVTIGAQMPTDVIIHAQMPKSIIHSNLVSTRRSGSTKLNRVISESRTND